MPLQETWTRFLRKLGIGGREKSSGSNIKPGGQQWTHSHSHQADHGYAAETPDLFANLSEVAAPPPVQNEGHDTLEDRVPHHRHHPVKEADDENGTLSEVAAPPPVREREDEAGWVHKRHTLENQLLICGNHPGGEVILRAVGASLEPYWDIITIHQKQEVHDILEQHFIGKIYPRDLVDGKAPTGRVDNPFKYDPQRDAALVQHSVRPCNAEPPECSLGSYITPTEKFYVRNHLWVPEVPDANAHRLTSSSSMARRWNTLLQDFRKKFKEYSIAATLQRSGNRRSHITQASRPTNGLQ
ncbi:hypothetical protein LTR74_016031 [Friedmanniomyces endolithicus]|nr:hypothetical protein LTR74_016031 [Friedmanniomyces endolithicus]